MRNTLIWVSAILIIALVAWMLLGHPSLLTQAPEQTDTGTPGAQTTFSYPDDFGLTYVHPVDWPPVLTLLPDTTYICAQTGEEITQTGKTEETIVNGNTYCKTTLSEGAAGSTYQQNTYVFKKDDRVYKLTFTTRMPQCLNYDNPEQSACIEEQNAFDVDALVDQMMQTLH